MPSTLIVFDTETATLSGAPHLLELGALRIEDGVVSARFESLVRPDLEIEPGATAVHGIRAQDVAHAPRAAEVLRAFADFAGEAPLAAHNAAFDARVLAFECTRRGLDAPNGPVHDSLLLARHALPEAPSHKLPELANLLQLPARRHHRALDDAELCWELIAHCLGRLGHAHSEPARWPERCARSLRIAACGPRAPERLAAQHAPLAHALARGGRALLLCAEPQGIPRRVPVVPRLLFATSERTYLEADCAHTAVPRTFRLDHILHVELQS